MLAGDNGDGKTTILDAVSDVFGRMLTKFPGITGTSPKAGDIRLDERSKPAPGLHIWTRLDASVECASLHEIDRKDLDGHIRVSRTKLRDGAANTLATFVEAIEPAEVVGVKNLDALAEALLTADAAGRNYLMPLVVYYGTDRAVFKSPLRRRNFKTHFPRFDSMNGALNSTANFKRVFEWFHAKETEEAHKQRELRSFEYEDSELASVRKAIERFFWNFKRPRTALKPLRFVVDKIEESGATKTFDLDQLSDGYRTSIAMIADLACRMVEANPPGTVDGWDPLATHAVVMIDEVDLHLHPKWQQTVLTDLRRVFPNSQFIVTTHSPQVLSSVEARCIRKLVSGEEETRIEIPDFALGARSVDLLESIQGVDARPPSPITAKLDRYRSLVEADDWDSEEARDIRLELDSWSNGSEAELRRIDIDIQLRKMRRTRA